MVLIARQVGEDGYGTGFCGCRGCKVAADGVGRLCEGTIGTGERSAVLDDEN
jgi:hypothetical protein